MYIDEDNRYDNVHNCFNCKFGYYAGISGDGWHNLCGAGNCYICVQNYKYCNKYEFGDIPDNITKM